MRVYRNAAGRGWGDFRHWTFASQLHFTSPSIYPLLTNPAHLFGASFSHDSASRVGSLPKHLGLLCGLFREKVSISISAPSSIISLHLQLAVSPKQTRPPILPDHIHDPNDDLHKHPLCHPSSCTCHSPRRTHKDHRFDSGHHPKRWSVSSHDQSIECCHRNMRPFERCSSCR